MLEIDAVGTTIKGAVGEDPRRHNTTQHDTTQRRSYNDLTRQHRESLCVLAWPTEIQPRMGKACENRSRIHAIVDKQHIYAIMD